MYWYCLITELLRSHFAKLTWCSGGSWSETKALHTPRSCIWGSCRTSFDFCSFAEVFGILVLHFADLCYLIGDIWDVPALRHFGFMLSFHTQIAEASSFFVHQNLTYSETSGFCDILVSIPILQYVAQIDTLSVRDTTMGRVFTSIKIHMHTA